MIKFGGYVMLKKIQKKNPKTDFFDEMYVDLNYRIN